MRYNFKNYKDYENISVNGVKILKCINPEVRNIKDRKFTGICVCGADRVIRQYDIVHRQKVHCKLCGYKKIALSKKKTDAGLNNLYQHYKKSSIKRKIQFMLEKEDFRRLTSANCVYCGAKPSLKSYSPKTWTNRSQYIYNTIDRIDSSLPYSLDNSVSCCKNCNLAKSTMTVFSFFKFIERVYFYMSNLTIKNKTALKWVSEDYLAGDNTDNH